MVTLSIASLLARNVKRLLLLIKCTLVTNAASEVNVLGHDRDALGVDGAEVCVFKKTDEERFGRLLERLHRLCLEAKFVLKVVGDLTNETLKGQRSKEEFAALLVAPNLS